jgi:hypothetical protein
MFGIRLINSLGSTVLEQALKQETTFQTSVQGLPRGIYLLEVQTQTRLITRKIIIGE